MKKLLCICAYIYIYIYIYICMYMCPCLYRCIYKSSKYNVGDNEKIQHGMRGRS